MLRKFALVVVVLAATAQAQNEELHRWIAVYAKNSVEAQLQARRANRQVLAAIEAGQVPVGYAEFYTARAADLIPLVVYQRITGTTLDNLAGGALTAAFSQRTDTQTEAPSESDASTSLVMKGLAPKVLAWAVEHGALHREVKDTNVTFRGNLAGIARALADESPVEVLFPEKTWWNGVSLAVTFDTNRGPQPGTLLANKQQIAAWTVRSELLNRRDPTAAQYRNQWLGLAVNEFNRLSSTSMEVTKQLQESNLMNNLIAELEKKVDEPSRQDVRDNASMEKWHAAAAEIAERQFAQIAAADLPGELRLAIEAYYEALEPALRRREELKAFIARGYLATVDFTVKRDVSLPDLSTFTGMFEISPDRARKHELTFNGSVSFFNALPQNATYKRLRDTKVSTQYDIPLKFAGGAGANMLMSFAGRWEHIPDPVPMSTNDALALVGAVTAPSPSTPLAAPLVPAGNIGVFQAKFTIPLGNTGMRLPLSFTTSNRKNLIEEKWSFGANFGLTLNFDALIPALKR
jgi:hypothetical protein